MRFDLLIAGIVAAILVSFNRNMWIGLFAGLLLMMIVGGRIVRGWLVGAVAVALVAVTLIASAGSDTSSPVLGSVVQRGSTLFSTQAVSRESSLTDRERETTVAWDTAKHHLLLGVGPGVDFGVSQALSCPRTTMT